MNLQTAQNKPIHLTDELGKGGEAAVYLVAEQPDVVAKLYHHPTAEREAKIRAMIQKPPMQPDDHVSLAWPTELLYQGQQFVGFMMPQVEGAESIFHFYNPYLRAARYPHFSWSMMHRLAINLVTVMQAIHDKGHVVGDINESNILVTYRVANPVHTVLFRFTSLFSRQAESYFLDNPLITFVDTDSFQVRDADGMIHRSLVAKPEYTPPELQGVRFAEVDQTMAHDLFGLGVLLFQMLMGGFHPFAGVLHSGESVGRVDLHNIREGVFPYHVNSQAKPPPAAPSFGLLHPALQRLFVACFVDGYHQPDQRPTAQAWQTALRRAEKHLTRCWDGHIYNDYLGVCPLCHPEEPIAPIAVETLPRPEGFRPTRLPAPEPEPEPETEPLSQTVQPPSAPSTGPIRVLGSTGHSGQALFDAITTATAGATLELEAGTYQLPQALVIETDLTLIGAGMAQTKLIGFQDTVALVVKGVNFEARDITFETGRERKQDVMQVYDAHVQLTACRFRRGFHGLKLQGTTTGQVAGCVLENNKQSGLRCGGNSAVAISQNQCRGNKDGISLTQQAKPSLTENVCRNNRANGLHYADFAGGTAHNNRCEENHQHGIVVSGSAKPILSQNVCHNNKKVGLYYIDLATGTAQQNSCLDNGQGGLVIETSAMPMLEGNITPVGNALQAGQRLVRRVASVRAGAIIKLKAGTYQLPDTLVVKNKLTLLGAGMNQTKIIGPKGKPVLSVQGQPLTVEEMTFEGAKAKRTSDLILVDEAEATITACRFQHGRQGITLRGKAKATITGCLLEHNAHGIVYCDSSGGTARQNHCQKNREGIVVMDEAAPLLVDNLCEKNEQSGVWYQGDTRGTARHNACHHNRADGLKVSGQAGPMLIENRCDHNYRGISYHDQAHGEAQGNLCDHNRRQGIVVNDDAHPTLTENGCSHNKQAGIHYYKQTSGTAMKNRCEHNRHGIGLSTRAQPTLVENVCRQNKAVGIRYADHAAGIGRQNQAADNGQADIQVLGWAKPRLIDNVAETIIFEIPPSPQLSAEARQVAVQAGRNLWNRIVAAEEGATLDLTAGTYHLPKPLIIRKALTLVGAGVEQTIIRGVDDKTVVTIEGIPFTAQGITFEGNDVDNQAVPDVMVSIHGDLTLNACCLRRGNAGLRLTGKSVGNISASVFEQNVASGLVYGDQSSGTASQNRCQANGQHGIAVFALAKPQLVENVCAGNKLMGIDYQGAIGGIIRKNRCLENRSFGIGVLKGAPELTDNHCEGNSRGISYASLLGGMIQRNHCQANRVSGIVVCDSAKPKVSDNVCRDNQSSGIEYRDEAAGLAENNLCQQNRYGIQVGHQARPTLVENRCQQNKAHGILYTGRASGTARRNHCVDNGQKAIALTAEVHPALEDNRTKIESSQTLKPTIVISPDGHQAGQVLFDKIMAAPAEATIALKAGRYQLPDTLILNKGVTLIGKGKDKTKLVGPSGKAVVEVNGAMFEARDITFEGGGEPQHKSVVEIRDSEITIVNCRFHQGYWGVVLQGKTTGTIRYCVIENNQSNGLVYYDQAAVASIQNICQFNGHAGIFHHASLGEGVFEQNLCIENKRGITVYCGKPTLLRNICIGNLLVGIAYGSLGSGVAKENICCNNGRGGIMLVDKASPILEDNIVGLPHRDVG